MNDEIKKTLEVIESLETRINSYWNFYIVVVLATIGWLMSSKTPFTENQGIALTIAIVLFFVANLSVLSSATNRVVAFEAELNSQAEVIEFKSHDLKRELSRVSLRFRVKASYLLHLVIDGAVIYAIWSKLA